LIKYGRSADTPAAIIYKGCTWEQRVLTCKLSELPDLAEKGGFVPPSITVIGDVVSKRDEIGRWFEELPLIGKSFLCTRPEDQNRKLALEITRLGGRAIISPLIEIKARDASDELRKAFSNLPEYNWTIFTSPRGVSIFFDQLIEEGRDSRSFGPCKIAAIGTATASALKERGIIADLVPEKFTAEGLLESFRSLEKTTNKPLKDQKILVPRAKEAREKLVTELREMNAQVTEIHTYDTIETAVFSEEAATALMNGEVDRVILCSPSTVQSYVNGLSKLKVDNQIIETGSTDTGNANTFKLPAITAIGPITAQRAEELNLNVTEIAEVHTIEGIIEACQSLSKPF
jgi:uroporphyrinogen III methyltransferase/synthase